MNIIRTLFAGLIFLALSASCIKNKINPRQYAATLRVVNAIAGDGSNIYVKAQIKPASFSAMPTQSYYAYDGQYANGTISYALKPDVFTPVQICLSSDTTHAVYQRSFKPLINDYYTLFLSGTPGQPDTMLVRENPVLRTDSTTGVRFVNLSASGRSYSINLAGNLPGGVVSTISYRQKTAYLSFPARAADHAYAFELRDAVTGDLLASYMYDNIARFKNVTLFIRGIPGSAPGVELMRISD